MNPGPELDKLIAERVMGWPTAYDAETDDWYDIAADEIPRYSTDIAAAWEVANRMTERGYSVEISSDVDAGAEVGFFLWNEEKQRFDVFNGEAGYKQAPYAICLAALASVDKLA